jgi:hypothetical protein
MWFKFGVGEREKGGSLGNTLGLDGANIFSMFATLSLWVLRRVDLKGFKTT